MVASSVPVAGRLENAPQDPMGGSRTRPFALPSPASVHGIRHRNENLSSRSGEWSELGSVESKNKATGASGPIRSVPRALESRIPMSPVRSYVAHHDRTFRARSRRTHDERSRMKRDSEESFRALAPPPPRTYPRRAKRRTRPSLATGLGASSAIRRTFALHRARPAEVGIRSGCPSATERRQASVRGQPHGRADGGPMAATWPAKERNAREKRGSGSTPRSVRSRSTGASMAGSGPRIRGSGR